MNSNMLLVFFHHARFLVTRGWSFKKTAIYIVLQSLCITLQETVDDFLLYFACGMFLLLVQE